MLRCRLPYFMAMVDSNWNDYISVNDVKLFTPLATPTTETYTIDTPISVLQGTFIFDIDTVVKPSQVDLTGNIKE